MGNHLEKSALEGKRFLHASREHPACALECIEAFQERLRVICHGDVLDILRAIGAWADFLPECACEHCSESGKEALPLAKNG